MHSTVTSSRQHFVPWCICVPSSAGNCIEWPNLVEPRTNVFSICIFIKRKLSISTQKETSQWTYTILRNENKYLMISASRESKNPKKTPSLRFYKLLGTMSNPINRRILQWCKLRVNSENTGQGKIIWRINVKRIVFSAIKWHRISLLILHHYPPKTHSKS